MFSQEPLPACESATGSNPSAASFGLLSTYIMGSTFLLPEAATPTATPTTNPVRINTACVLLILASPGGEYRLDLAWAQPPGRAAHLRAPVRWGSHVGAAGPGRFLMKSLTRYLTMNVAARMEFVNITKEVQEAVHDSGVREGLCLVNAMHITASVFINDDEAGLHEDYKRWLERLAPFHPPPTAHPPKPTG